MILFLTCLFCFGTFVLFWSVVESCQRQINLHTVTLSKKKLSRPLRVLHLTDIHFSTSDRRLSLFFDRLAKEVYDLVVITGDIFDAESGIETAKENLRKLKAKAGIYAVFGNHDYYDYLLWDIATMGLRGRRHPDTQQPVELFEKALAEAGVTLLKNEKASFQWDGQTISLYGLDDPTTGHADIEKTMHDDHPEDINILLTHTIDAFFYIGENEIDVSFSGHSHGGQIRFPWIGPLITHTQLGPTYAAGIKELKGAVCSISRGVGASRFFSLRLLCRPEAIILNLQ